MSKAKAKTPRVFVPLTKVDEEQRLVYGTITQEVLDKSGEVMDYAMSKPHFEKWSGDIHAASGGLSKGNLRVMHGLTVAGKLTELEFNDDDQSIEVCSKVIDDNEWNKVLEGCYTGFSVGGKYGKKWNDKAADGTTIKKYEAIPNEVSLVDNPCVPSATFSLVKADGAEEQIMFKAAGDQNDPGDENPEQEVSQETTEGDAPKQADESAAVTPVEPKSEDVAKRAGELAAAAADGTAWVDHIETARAELMKAATSEEKPNEAPGPDEGEETEEEPAAEDADEADPGVNDSASVEKVTPSGVKQKWTASDGQLFDKKADAVAHEEGLAKAAAEPTEADKLAARLAKALDPKTDEEEPELPLFEDFDRLSKAVAAISTPFENGEPKLEKGMYTVNRFSHVLSDMASLSRTIKAEGKKEGDDASDATVSDDIIAAVKTLGASFITYAQNQVTELLAGLDDGVVVEYYDYYYNAATVDPENGLAKDVCSLITDLREPAKETRETMAKAFGLIIGETLEAEDELSPPLQKRFDELQAENAELKKVATTAVEAVETLTKRIEAVEDTPMPRAPTNGHVAFKEGDVEFLGKRFSNPDALMNEVHDLIKTKGADALAVELIKASQASGGQRLHLNR